MASAKFLARWSAARNEEERKKLAATADSDDAMGQGHGYQGRLDAEGGFRFEGVSPGIYELQLRPVATPATEANRIVPFTCTHPVEIPAAAAGAEDVAVNLGKLELKREEPAKGAQR